MVSKLANREVSILKVVTKFRWKFLITTKYNKCFNNLLKNLMRHFWKLAWNINLLVTILISIIQFSWQRQKWEKLESRKIYHVRKFFLLTYFSFWTESRSKIDKCDRVYVYSRIRRLSYKLATKRKRVNSFSWKSPLTSYRFSWWAC